MPPLTKQTRAVFFATMMATSVLAIALAGCRKGSFQSSKEIPASLRDSAPKILKGKLARTWGGDNFEVGQKHQLHYFLLIGVDCPEPGQPYFNEACDHLINTCSDREIEMEVLQYDELKREIGHAWVINADGERVNLATDLLSKGLGWHNGIEFEGSDQYREIMESARAEKLGLWSQPNPTPPWEHWKMTRDAIRGKK